MHTSRSRVTISSSGQQVLIENEYGVQSGGSESFESADDRNPFRIDGPVRRLLRIVTWPFRFLVWFTLVFWIGMLWALLSRRS